MRVALQKKGVLQNDWKNNPDTVFAQGNQPYVLNNYFIECHLMTADSLMKKLKKMILTNSEQYHASRTYQLIVNFEHLIHCSSISIIELEQAFIGYNS